MCQATLVPPTEARQKAQQSVHQHHATRLEQSVVDTCRQTMLFLPKPSSPFVSATRAVSGNLKWECKLGEGQRRACDPEPPNKCNDAVPPTGRTGDLEHNAEGHLNSQTKIRIPIQGSLFFTLPVSKVVAEPKNFQFAEGPQLLRYGSCTSAQTVGADPR